MSWPLSRILPFIILAFVAFTWGIVCCHDQVPAGCSFHLHLDYRQTGLPHSFSPFCFSSSHADCLLVGVMSLSQWAFSLPFYFEFSLLLLLVLPFCYIPTTSACVFVIVSEWWMVCMPEKGSFMEYSSCRTCERRRKHLSLPKSIRLQWLLYTVSSSTHCE